MMIAPLGHFCIDRMHSPCSAGYAELYYMVPYHSKLSNVSEDVNGSDFSEDTGLSFKGCILQPAIQTVHWPFPHIAIRRSSAFASCSNKAP